MYIYIYIYRCSKRRPKREDKLTLLELGFWTWGFLGPYRGDDFVLLGWLFLFLDFILFQNVFRKGIGVSFDTILQRHEWMHTV